MVGKLWKACLGLLAGIGFSAAAPGPWLPPEYAPARAVLLSDIVLEDHNGYLLLDQLLQARAEVWLLSRSARLSELRTQLQALTGLTLPKAPALHILPIPTDSVWARDWAPLFTFTASSSPLMTLLDAEYWPNRPQDDAVPQRLSQQPLTGPLRVLPLNLSLEGGDLACSRRVCVISSRALAGRPFAELQSKLARAFRQPLVLAERLPYESTGHLDMWTKFLDDETLLIAQVVPEAQQGLDKIPPPLRESYAEIGAFLERQATGVDATGLARPEALVSRLRAWMPRLKVVRVPLPLPFAEHGELIFRSYVNSLLVNGRAILPRYARDGYGHPYPDQPALRQYERQVEAVYRQAGYDPVWIPADYLILSGGAWHCATMQVPAYPSPSQ